MSIQSHQQELEAYYRKQIDGRTVFWRDKYKPYMSLYRNRRLRRDSQIASALPVPLTRAVDLGCGQGDLLALLVPRAQMVVGMDLAEVMVRTARENLRDCPNVRVLCSPAETVPLQDNSIDAVILADVIEHLVDPLGCLREVRRVLRPGGRLIVTTPNAAMEFFWKRLDGMLNAPFRWLRRHKRKPNPPVLEHLFRREELAGLARQAEFRIHQHRLIEFYPGSEGGGTFGRVLRLIARQKHIRQWLVEPLFGSLFAAIERLERFNNRQLLVLEKP